MMVTLMDLFLAEPKIQKHLSEYNKGITNNVDLIVGKDKPEQMMYALEFLTATGTITQNAIIEVIVDLCDDGGIPEPIKNAVIHQFRWRPDYLVNSHDYSRYNVLYKCIYRTDYHDLNSFFDGRHRYDWKQIDRAFGIKEEEYRQ